MRLLWLKAWRDLWHNLSAFLACIAMMALAVALLIGFSSAYVNLGQSTAFTYERLAFLDASVNLRNAQNTLVDRVRSLPGVAAAEGRRVLTVRLILPDGEKIMGSVLGIPSDRALSVNRLVIHEGNPLRLGRGECLLERRFARLHGYRPGDRIELEIGLDHRHYQVAGLVSSPEYLWLTQDRLDPRPAARRFGLLFLSHADVASLAGNKEINELHLRWKDPQNPPLRQLESFLEGLREGPLRGRDQQASYSLLERDRRAFAGVASVFPAALLSLAGLMLFLTLWQLIHQQRKQIGILLCQGLSPAWVAGHYLLLAALVALTASSLGSLAGPWLGHWATQYYVDTLGLPFSQERIQGTSVVLGWVTALVLALLSAAAALRNLLRARPLDLLRSEFLAHSALPGFLRWLPLRLSFRWLFPLRNLLRQPWRSLTMVAGVGMSNALLLMTLALFDSQKTTLEFYLTQVHRYDLQVNLDMPRPSSQRPPVALWPEVDRVEEVLRVPATLLHGEHRLERGIWGLPESCQLLHLYDSHLRPLTPGPGLLLSPLQWRELGLGSGDAVEVEIPTGEKQPPLHRLSLGPALYEPIQGPPKLELTTLQTLYARVSNQPREVINTFLIKAQAGQANNLRARLYQDTRVREVVTMKQYREDIADLLRLLLAYFSLMLVCSGLIALALVHACTTMNLSERRAEVACMLVQGVRHRDLFALLLGEAGYLWILGLGVGIPAGYWAGDWLLSHYQSDLIDLRLQLLPRTVAWTALASWLVTLLASLRAILALLQIPLAEATRSPD